MALADDLNNWTDWDGAAYALGQALGLFQGESFLRTKGVFWTANDLGEALHDTLLALARGGVLERREEPDEQFRWRDRLA